MDVRARLDDVRQRILRACADAGRSADDVVLLAVTKFQPVERLREAADAGQRDFAENYAQDLRDKAVALPDVRWHAIGPLQRNKAKYVAKAAYAFHALDRLEIAVELARGEKGRRCGATSR